MTDEDGNEIDVAKHAQMKVRLYLGKDFPALEPFTMMRKETAKKAE